MKVVCCGSRFWKNKDLCEKYIRCLPSHAIVITGGCKGGDKLSDQVATDMKLKTKLVLPDWSKGRCAGPIRNSKMIAEKPDLVLAFAEDVNKTKGTRDTVSKAMKKKIKVFTVSKEFDTDFLEWIKVFRKSQDIYFFIVSQPVFDSLSKNTLNVVEETGGIARGKMRGFEMEVVLSTINTEVPKHFEAFEKLDICEMGLVEAYRFIMERSTVAVKRKRDQPENSIMSQFENLPDFN
jgi:hypothetical protein